ncbi:MAG: hypothetical protein KDA28_07970 [Phycisphaerales bacterium]|nr:hypothetical protein [Phycisphaerales bacterium]
MNARLLLALPLIALVAACSPSMATYHQRVGFDAFGEEQTPRDREANAEALDDLLDRAEAIASGEEEAPEIPEGAMPQVIELPFDSVAADDAPNPSGSTTLRREDLDALLAGGPHAVLGVVLLEPARQGDSLVGFAISEVYRGGEFVFEAGLTRGDVVQSINGISIVNPEDVMSVWEALSEADSVEIEWLRDGESRSRRWDVVTDVASAQ